MSSKFSFKAHHQKITAVDGNVRNIDNRNVDNRCYATKPSLDVFNFVLTHFANAQTITTNANILINILNEQSQWNDYLKLQTIEEKQNWIHDILTDHLKHKQPQIIYFRKFNREFTRKRKALQRSSNSNRGGGYGNTGGGYGNAGGGYGNTGGGYDNRDRDRFIGGDK
eukprot:9803_1